MEGITLGKTELRILESLARNDRDRPTMMELAYELDVDYTTIARNRSKLQAKGLIMIDTQKARSTRVSDAGLAYLDRLAREANDDDGTDGTTADG